MDDEERVAMLKRVNRQSATVGASLPETITVGGNELDLPEFLVETRKLDRIPPETKETLQEAKQALRAERKRRVERLESEPLDREPAEALADEIVGIERALNALDSIREPSYGERARAAER
ncbi:MAG: DUF5788 family protein, partial [Halobacteriales archaeon]